MKRYQPRFSDLYFLSVFKSPWFVVFANIQNPYPRIHSKMGITYFRIGYMRYGLNRQIRIMSPKGKQIKAYGPTSGCYIIDKQ